jgi:hypothetical protein
VILLAVAVAVGEDENLDDLDNSDNLDDGDDDTDYIMPPKRHFTKQPTAAKKKGEDDVRDTSPYAHKLCDISSNAINVAEVTITINGFVDPAAYKIDLASKGSALLFRQALPKTFFDK